MTAYTNAGSQPQPGHYADLNGLHLYYELYGAGKPLVLLHGGGSTIESTFGHIIPALAKKYSVIAIELQAHGRTKDIDRPLTFEQDADDVSALLDHLQIEKASVFGFSNGATTAMQIAIRHPEKVDRLVLASVLYNRSGVHPMFWEGFKDAHIGMMPQALKEAFLKVMPDQAGLQAMFDRDVQRMSNFKDIKEEDIRTITAPALIVGSDQDVIYPEHAVALYRMLPHAQLLVLPGIHGEWFNALEAHKDQNPLPGLTLPMITAFLDAEAGK